MPPRVSSPLARNRPRSAQGLVPSFRRSETPSAAGINAAFQSAAGVADFFATQIEAENEVQDQVDAIRLQGEYRRIVDERTAALDPLSKTFGKDVQSIAEEERTRIAETAGLRTQAVSNRLGIALETDLQTTLGVALVRKKQAVSAEAVRVRGEALDTTLSNIRNDPDGAPLYVQEFKAQAAELAAGISPEKLKELEAGFADKVVTNQIIGLAEQGRFDEARRLQQDKAGQFTREQNTFLKNKVTEIETKQFGELHRASAQAIVDLQIGIENGDISPTKARELLEKMDREGVFQRQEGKEVTLNAAIVARGKFDQGEARNRAINDIEAKMILGDLTLEQLLQIREGTTLFQSVEGQKAFSRLARLGKAQVDKKEAKADATKAKNFDRVIGDLQLAITDGRLRRGDLNQEEFVKAFHDNPGKKAQLAAQIAARERETMEDIAEAAASEAKIRGGTGLGSQKEADNLFTHRLATGAIAVDPLDPGTLISAGVKFAAQSGFLPTALRDIVASGDRIDKAENLALAALIHQSTMRFSPGVNTGAGDRVKLTADAQKHTGMSYIDSARMLLSRAGDPKRIQEREKAFRKFTEQEFDPRTDLEGAFFGFFARTFPGALGVDVEVLDEYTDRVKAFYLLTGDLELARKSAANRVAERFGVTNVGFENTLTRHPIENRLSSEVMKGLDRDERSAMINGLVTRALKAAGHIIPDINKDNVPDFALLPTKTADARAASGSPIEYHVMVRDPNGILTSLWFIPEPITGVLQAEPRRATFTAPTYAEVQETPEWKARVAEENKRFERARGQGKPLTSGERRDKELKRIFQGKSTPPGLGDIVVDIPVSLADDLVGEGETLTAGIKAASRTIQSLLDDAKRIADRFGIKSDKGVVIGFPTPVSIDIMPKKR